MRKHKAELQALGDEAEDIYVQTKLKQTYRTSEPHPTHSSSNGGRLHPLHRKRRPKKLQRKMKILAFIHMEVMILANFLPAKQIRGSSQQQLDELITENEWQPDSTDTRLAVIRCLQYKNISTVVIKTTEERLSISWYSIWQPKCYDPLVLGGYEFGWITSRQIWCHWWWTSEGLSKFHWIMNMKPRDELIQVSTTFPPGSTLPDQIGHYWCRRDKMCFTRTMFLSSVGYNQEMLRIKVYLTHSFNVRLSYSSVPSQIMDWVVCAKWYVWSAFGCIELHACMQSALSTRFNLESWEP